MSENTVQFWLFLKLLYNFIELKNFNQTNIDAVWPYTIFCLPNKPLTVGVCRNWLTSGKIYISL